MDKDELIKRIGMYAVLFNSLDHKKCHDLWIALGSQFGTTEMIFHFAAFHFAASGTSPGYVVRVSRAQPDELEQVRWFVSGFLRGWRARENPGKLKLDP